MAETSSMKTLLYRLISQQMSLYPLPWIIVRDWTYEVTTSDGNVIIAKFMNHHEAEELIALAEKIHAEYEKIGKQIMKEVNEYLTRRPSH